MIIGKKDLSGSKTILLDGWVSFCMEYAKVDGEGPNMISYIRIEMKEGNRIVEKRLAITLASCITSKEQN